MCGLVGWVDWNADLSSQEAVIERMAETMRRRGPDEKGTWVSTHAALGHRRLSVIDPSNGQQPMTFIDAAMRMTLVYNGELYNFRELRKDLEQLGHAFRTHCDTEVILHSFMEWGADCVQRFDGIFAFGIWDDVRQRLFLARDRLGVKPLFFTQRNGSFLFASEIKALLAHPDVPAEVDNDGLCELFITPPPTICPTPGRTAYRGILQLRPGRHLTVDHGDLVEVTYWERTSKPHTDDVETTVRRIGELLDGAVKRQLVADVPLACLLSGGVDSSGIAAFAQRELRRDGKRLGTWCIDFVDHERDYVQATFLPSRDAPVAQEMADFLGTDHHNVVVGTPQMLETMLDVMRSRDLPTGTQIDTSLLLLFKAIKKEATVALSGEASDEVFGGYPWFWGDPPDAPAFPWIAAGFPFGTSPELTATLDPHVYLRRRYEEAIAEVPHLAGETDAESTWRRSIYLGQTRWLHYLLSRKDCLSMYASVEGRVPFCDHQLVEYAWNIPSSFARLDGVEKSLLRRALRGLLPETVLNRKKSAFPLFENPLYVAEVKSRARDVLADRNSPARPLFDVAHLQRRCDDAVLSGRDTRTPGESVTVLEKFIQTDAWMREYQIRLV